MSSGDDQRSQASAKPAFSEAQACALVESVYGFKVSKIQPLPSYDDQNFRVCILRTEGTTDGPTEYVFKISNTESSKTPDLTEVQTHVIMFLQEAGFPTSSVCRTKGDNLTSLVSVDGGSEIKSYLVRLLTYLPGRPIAEIPVSPQLAYEIGRLAAKLDKTLEKFHHPELSCLRRENFIWNLKNVPLLEKYLYALGQDRNRELVEQVIRLFKDEVMTNLSHFRECINHGDLNDHNILVESSKSAFGDAVYHVSGILDFDDMSYGYYVFEVAITIMYMMIESKDPIQLHPENEEYLMITAKTGWKHLQQMFDMGRKAVEEIWFNTAKSYEPGISM